ncbi:MAG: Fic family protein [Myxococcota bacterium]
MARAYGIPFGFCAIPAVQRGLHRFDRENVAKLLVSALGNEEAINEYRIRQLLEEAISSSLIEGARPTTREVARQMVREGREPASRDERMIANNWRGMRRILELRDEYRPLRVEDLKELHRILGEEALDVPGTEGTFRGPGDDVRVEDAEGTIWHVPPDAKGLVDRMEALLRFAEGEEEGEANFIHPILRAIIAHFWLAYEHPFRDGNGRVARALFYWCMLRHGYEMAEFLSISGPIDRKPHAYYLAFAYTETDRGDLTYFILHQLDVLSAAVKELQQHLRERATRVRELERLVAHTEELNHRQRALLQHAIHHPTQSYSIKGHAQTHGVHYNTAAADLADLIDRRLLIARQVGKGKRFYLAPRLKERLAKRRHG